MKFLYSRTVFCSVYRNVLKLRENMFQQRSYFSSQAHKNIPGCYNKSINWSNSSDIIANDENFLRLRETQNALQLPVFFFSFFCQPYTGLRNCNSVFLILKISQYGRSRRWFQFFPRNPCKNRYENWYLHFYKTYDHQNWEAGTSTAFDSTSRRWSRARNKLKALYLLYQSVYGHQSWQDLNLPWWVPVHKVT